MESSLAAQLHNMSLSRPDESHDDVEIVEARRCATSAPDSVNAHLRLGQLLNKKGYYIEACNVYANAIKRNRGFGEVLKPHLITANKKCGFFSEDSILVIQFGDLICPICKETKNLLRCSQCKVVNYCSGDHQNQHWSAHKTVCVELKQATKDKEICNMLCGQVDCAAVVKIIHPFKSLHCVREWKHFWLRCEINYTMPPIIQSGDKSVDIDVLRNFLSLFWSWPMTFVASLCKFELAQKSHVEVHILGADDKYFSTSLMGRQTLSIFPINNARITLIGPELSARPSSNFKTAVGKRIELNYVGSTWAEYMKVQNIGKPDLIVACNAGFHDPTYPWKETVREIVIQAIPTVVTCFSQSDYDKTLELLAEEVVNTNIVFKGESPFASQSKNYCRDKLDVHEILRRNWFWIGFRGGNPMTNDMVVDRAREILSDPNLTPEALRAAFKSLSK